MRSDVYRAIRAAIEEERPALLVTVLDGPAAGSQWLASPPGDPLAGLPAPAEAAAAARAHFPAILERRAAERVRVETAAGTIDLFLEPLLPRPHLVVVGAGHVAIPLVHVARLVGYRTTVVDPRATFATRDRFPHADELLVAWPDAAFPRLGIHESTAVAVLSHDAKIDVPALSAALRSRAFYVGVLGSRKTHAERERQLRELGHRADELARIRSPIGLDLGGREPQEIAVAIVAEIVALGHGVPCRGTPRAAQDPAGPDRSAAAGDTPEGS